MRKAVRVAAALSAGFAAETMPSLSQVIHGFKYNRTKRRLPTTTPAHSPRPPFFHPSPSWQETGKLTNTSRLLAGLGAGVSEAVLIVTPFEVVKTRLQQQKGTDRALLKYKVRCGWVGGWTHVGGWEDICYGEGCKKKMNASRAVTFAPRRQLTI